MDLQPLVVQNRDEAVRLVEKADEIEAQDRLV
jgi:hypothetical protein